MNILNFVFFGVNKSGISENGAGVDKMTNTTYECSMYLYLFCALVVCPDSLAAAAAAAATAANEMGGGHESPGN